VGFECVLLASPDKKNVIPKEIHDMNVRICNMYIFAYPICLLWLPAPQLHQDGPQRGRHRHWRLGAGPRAPGHVDGTFRCHLSHGLAGWPKEGGLEGALEWLAMTGCWLRAEVLQKFLVAVANVFFFACSWELLAKRDVLIIIITWYDFLGFTELCLVVSWRYPDSA